MDLPVIPMPAYVTAGLWGLVSGSGLLLGAIVADVFFGKLSHRMVAAVMGFGGGVLFAVIATELVVRPDSAGAALWPTVALPVGAAVFSGINWYLARRGAKNRKRCGECVEQPAEAELHGSGSAIAVGSVLDGIPEALVIGMSVAGGRAISLAVIAGFFLANVPQGLSSTSGMKQAGRSRRYVYTVWLGIPLLIGVGTQNGPRYTLRFCRAFDGAHLAKRSERGGWRIGIGPEVIAGEIDMLPTER